MPSFSTDYRGLIEAGLTELLPSGRLRGGARLNEALRYAVFPGGKRMRPMLALLGARVCGAGAEGAVPAACATEFLHASSLIFDDLPAMDDADVRRGRPALHLVFGEDIALLAGLALLNQAYAIFGRSPELMGEAARCIGVNGMIGGQAADLEFCGAGGATGDCVSRNQKTTALMRLTLTAGALACEAPEEDVRALARCGECLGSAYQIYDDLLDEWGRREFTGKPERQDLRHHRPSNVAEYGVDAALEQVAVLVDEAKAVLLKRFGNRGAVPELIRAIDGVVSKASAADLVSA